MTVQDFFEAQEPEIRETFTRIHNLIIESDPSVHPKIGSVMSKKHALVYEQEGVFKYGLTKTKNHFSYHSMVMYLYPEIVGNLRALTKGIKFQKGCFNFNSMEQLNPDEFAKLLDESSKRDFSPVINRYKN